MTTLFLRYVHGRTVPFSLSELLAAAYPPQAIRMDRLHIARHARQIARIRASLAAAAG